MAKQTEAQKRAKDKYRERKTRAYRVISDIAAMRGVTIEDILTELETAVNVVSQSMEF